MSGTSPVVTRRHSAISSLRASATNIVVLRAPLGPSVRVRYHCASALSFWNIRKRPRQLDQPTSYPRIAGLGQALLSAFQTALVGRSREPGVARHRSSISKLPRQDLLHQHVRRLDADTDHPGEQPHHRMRPCIGGPLEPLGTCLLDRADLLTDQCQPSHVAPELLDDVCRQARALRCPQTCQTLRRLAQMRLESPNPETGERTLHAVGDARALVDKALALAAPAPPTLLLPRRDPPHPPAPPLPA